MSMENHIEQLRRRHADLDSRLSELSRSPSVPEAEITSLKRNKLRLKDEINRLTH